MGDAAGVPAGVDPATPNVARMYDYYLGGKNNYAADRDAAEKILSLMPEARQWVKENRLFLAAAVSHLASLGVRQFIDVGAGLPTQRSVHEVASPDARVVYVDIDPVVVAHARALLASEDRIDVVQADMHDPSSIFDDPKTRELIDFDQPVAVLLVALLHFIPDDAEAASIAAGMHASLPSGSYLVLTHAMPGDVSADVVKEGRQVYSGSSAGSITPRTPDRVAALFAGLDLLPPGLTNVTHWTPGDAPPLDASRPGFIGAIARKP
jgi:hypothetical protein